VVHAGAPTIAVASKGPVAPAAGPAGALSPTLRKRKPVEGWPTTVAAAVPAGASMTAAAAKELVALTAGALEPAATKGGQSEGGGTW
jgi:hypothetical protein